MPVFKPKSKMISIRLSDEEYEGLKSLCVSSGARSVSDLAREAMGQMLRPGHNGHTSPVELRIQELQGRLHLLEQTVARIDGAK
jgi:Arc/MetJ-type ribon-helix-helix transcriptional regulator